MDDTKAKLRKLRDKLAFETPRAQARPSTPPELVRRMQTALETVTAAFRLAGAPLPTSPAAADAAEEVIEDALVEAHLALNDWERTLAQTGKNKALPLSDRRQHTRQEAYVTVRLLRHALHEHGNGVELTTETANRPARNVSLGGMFVTATRQDLPEVRAGSVLHVALETSLGSSLAFRARAVVVRRDDAGIALRWIVEGERVRNAIDALLAALSRARLGA